MQLVPITTNVVSSNPAQAVYSIQHYVIRFINDLIATGQWFSPLVSSTNKTEILLKVLLNTITLIKESLISLLRVLHLRIYFDRKFN